MIPLINNQKIEISTILFLSFLEIIISIILLFTSSNSYELNIFYKPIIGSIFILVSMLGVSAVFFPKICSSIFFRNFKENLSKKTDSEKISSESIFYSNHENIIGHHPNCEKFTNHVFHVGKRNFCSGCIGMGIGAIISIFGSLVYFFGNLFISHFMILWFLFILALIGIFLGLILPIINIKKTAIRIIINNFFIFSMFILVASLDSLHNSFFLDILMISFCVFWLFSRIAISQWTHHRICLTCEDNCKFGSK